MKSNAFHVIVGTGHVGQPLAEQLLVAGHRFRIAKRTPAPIPAAQPPRCPGGDS